MAESDINLLSLLLSVSLSTTKAVLVTSVSALPMMVFSSYYIKGLRSLPKYSQALSTYYVCLKPKIFGILFSDRFGSVRHPFEIYHYYVW